MITSGRLLGIALSNRWQLSTAAQVCCLIATVALTLSIVVDSTNTFALCMIGVAVVACGPCYALILGTGHRHDETACGIDVIGVGRCRNMRKCRHSVAGYHPFRLVGGRRHSLPRYSTSHARTCPGQPTHASAMSA